MLNFSFGAALSLARRANPASFVRTGEARRRAEAFGGPEGGLGVVVVVAIGVRGVFRPSIERPHKRG